MKSAFRILTLAACGMIACSVPASSVTLKPGTYKLQWTVPDANNSPINPLGELWMFLLEEIKPEQTKNLEGIVSDKPYAGAGKDDRITLIIDESKGTGNGYDVAYLVAGTLDANKVKLSQCTKIPLGSDKPTAAMVPFGKNGSQIQRKVELIADLINVREKERLCAVRALGNWSGMIQTDSGEVPVYVADGDGNGIFNDKQSRDEFDTNIMGDSILIGDPPKGATSVDQVIESLRTRMLYPNQVNNYAGKLYNISINEAGDSLEVQPYEGPSAMLKLEIKNSNNKPMSTGYAKLSAGKSAYFDVYAGKPLLLPTGTYQCSSYITWVKPAQEPDPGYQFTLVPSRAIQVTSGQTTLLSLGGPVSVGIAPGPDVIEVDPAKDDAVNIVAMVGQDRFTKFEGSGSSITFRITDARGILISEGNTSRRIKPNQEPVSLAASLPKGLKPGTYWLEVIINTGTYQKPATAKKQMIVK